jgi:hypothetical protein
LTWSKARDYASVQGALGSTGSTVVPNSIYLADRLRAHARLYRHIAEEMWNEDQAQELVRLADECTYAADSIVVGAAAAEFDVAGPSAVEQNRAPACAN